MKKIRFVVLKILTIPQYFFAVIALVFGGLFILLTPPLQTPDETVHFLRAYQVSEFGVFDQKKDAISGDYLPSSIRETENIVNTPQLNFNPAAKYDLHRTAAALNVDLSEEQETFYDISSASIYSPIGYLPQAIGIGIGRVVDAPTIMLIYLARCFSLLSWVALVFFSIKLIPFKKWAIAALGLLPMAIAQAGSVGVDAISIGLGILFITYILQLRQSSQKIIGVKQAAVLVAITAAMLLTKQVMIALLPLVMLLPRQKIRIKKIPSMISKILIGTIPLLLLLIWTYAVRDVSQSAAQVANGQDSVDQIKFLLDNPFRFIAILFNTFFFTWGDEVIRSFIGNFGWVDTPLSAPFIMFGYITVAFLLCVNYENVKQVFNVREKIIIASTVLLYILAVCGGLYLIFTPVSFSIIIGIQGRYFLPIAFLLVPLLWSVSIKASKSTYINYARVAPVTLLIASAFTIMFRYYGLYGV